MKINSYILQDLYPPIRSKCTYCSITVKYPQLFQYYVETVNYMQNPVSLPLYFSVIIFSSAVHTLLWSVCRGILYPIHSTERLRREQDTLAAVKAGGGCGGGVGLANSRKQKSWAPSKVFPLLAL
jgi:hypothetical protein